MIAKVIVGTVIVIICVAIGYALGNAAHVITGISSNLTVWIGIVLGLFAGLGLASLVGGPRGDN